jgi:uncharacterized membrane protein
MAFLLFSQLSQPNQRNTHKTFDQEISWKDSHFQISAGTVTIILRLIFGKNIVKSMVVVQDFVTTLHFSFNGVHLQGLTTTGKS